MQTDPTSPLHQIRQHSRQLVRELNVLKVDYLDTGFTFSQCHVLFELWQHKGLHLMELAEHLLLDKSNTSRTLKKLVQMGLVKAEKVEADNRQKLFQLTPKGEKALRAIVELADAQVQSAIDNLSEGQQATVISGLKLYANALTKCRLQEDFVLRRIQQRDNAQIAQIIRDVMTEFGAVGAGYSINDPEVGTMFANYQDSQSCYYVIVRDKKIVGGGGLAPLAGGDKVTCELRKMFFLPEIRGLGLGQRLLNLLLKEARARGYRRCYLETLDRMPAANALYRNNGFQPLDQPMGCTGHTSCDRRYLREL